jgi:ABC-2 type transport system permease protein
VVGQTLMLDVAEVRAIYTWRTWIFGWLLRLLCQATFFALIGRYVGSPGEMRYVLVGNVVVLLCLEAAIVVLSMAGERRSGTLPLLAVAPASHLPIYLGRGLHWLVTGLTSTTVAWLVLPPLLGVPLPWPRAAYALPLFLVVGLSSYGYACVLAALALRWPGLQWLILNLGYLVVMAFGGVNVPRSFWPFWLRALTEVLPVSHGLTAVRGVLAGVPAGNVLGSAALELLVAAGWFAVAAFSIDRLVTAGRRNGTLELAA